MQHRRSCSTGLRRSKLGAVALAVVGALTTLAACSAGGEQGASGGQTNAAIAADYDKCISGVKEKVSNKGPNGEDPTPARQLTLTDDEINKIRAMGKTAAVAWHLYGSDYSTAQLEALRKTFDLLGIKLLTATDGQFSVGKQTNDISTILTLKPDFLVSLPVDAPAQSDIYKQVADAGIGIVFAINAPSSMVQGKDYLTVVGTDDYGTGLASACGLVKAINGEGEVGVIFHEANYYATAQRKEAALEVFSRYPGIKVVDQKGIPGPDIAAQSAAITNSWLARYPEMKGIWTPWDTPAEGVIAAAREQGKTGDTLAVSTIDLGENVAVDMAYDGMIKEVGGGQPYNQGVAQAMAIGYSLLGKPLAPYYAWNAVPANKSNVGEAWTDIYNVEPPAALLDAIKAK